ncbi:uncharacterized protein LOC123296585 [Chrysoperla carnea]|uniref:uncharacterized protein LOC123296585 n=1 Tax=Chrysoperla carnea TaxID=189513 RepID=UPI001D063EE4|nr:uncharacterized protein LOC123296585 [Chrysoperla carnea]
MPIQKNKTNTVPFNDLPRVSMENINLLKNQCDMVYSTSLVLPLVQNEKFKAVKTIASGNQTKIANLLVSRPPYMSVEREDFEKNDDRLKFNRPEQDTTSLTELTLPVVSRASRSDCEISLCHSLDLPQECKNEFIASKKVVGEIVNRSLRIPPHLSNDVEDLRKEACREGKSTSLASTSGQTKITRKSQVLSKRDLQIVFRSVRRGGTIRYEEASALRKHIVEEMKKAMNNSRTELRFRKSGIVDPGWFLVTADDEISRDWLLTEYRPSSINGICFSAFTQKAAQRIVRIGFELRTRDINITKVIELLKIQNRQLNIDSWQFLQKERSKKRCFLTFGVDKEDLRRLESAKWTLYYELFTLKVRKLSS